MRGKLVEKFINLVIGKWGNRAAHKFLLGGVIRFFDEKQSGSKYIFDNDFEISLVENKNNIRMLHLLFLNDETPLQNAKAILEKRQKSIVEFFKNINEKFIREYNLQFLEKFFDFNRRCGLFPIQFGLDYNRESLFLRLKVYLSIIEQNFSLKKFSENFHFNYTFLRKIFWKRQYDSVAVDFFKNGDYQFKFYAISGGRGALYRVNPPDKIFSVKHYIRIPEGIFMKEIPDKFKKFKIDKNLKNFIKTNKLKIHYLAEEDNKKSFYFR